MLMRWISGPIEGQGLRRERQESDWEQKNLPQSEKVSTDGNFNFSVNVDVDVIVGVVSSEGSESGPRKVLVSGIFQWEREHRVGQNVAVGQNFVNDQRVQKKPLQKNWDEKIDSGQAREKRFPEIVSLDLRREDQQSGGDGRLIQVQEDWNEQVGSSQEHRPSHNPAGQLSRTLQAQNQSKDHHQNAKVGEIHISAALRLFPERKFPNLYTGFFQLFIFKEDSAVVTPERAAGF